jgi:hypothetical protein
LFGKAEAKNSDAGYQDARTDKARDSSSMHSDVSETDDDDTAGELDTDSDAEVVPGTYATEVTSTASTEGVVPDEDVTLILEAQAEEPYPLPSLMIPHLDSSLCAKIHRMQRT